MTQSRCRSTGSPTFGDCWAAKHFAQLTPSVSVGPLQSGQIFQGRWQVGQCVSSMIPPRERQTLARGSPGRP